MTTTTTTNPKHLAVENRDGWSIVDRNADTVVEKGFASRGAARSRLAELKADAPETTDVEQTARHNRPSTSSSEFLSDHPGVFADADKRAAAAKVEATEVVAFLKLPRSERTSRGGKVSTPNLDYLDRTDKAAAAAAKSKPATSSKGATSTHSPKPETKGYAIELRNGNHAGIVLDALRNKTGGRKPIPTVDAHIEGGDWLVVERKVATKVVDQLEDVAGDVTMFQGRVLRLTALAIRHAAKLTTESNTAGGKAATLLNQLVKSGDVTSWTFHGRSDAQSTFEWVDGKGTHDGMARTVLSSLASKVAA